MTFSLKAKVFDELRRRRTRSLVEKNTLWPSQASVVTRTGEVIGKCLRASFYEKTGETPTNPVDDNIVAMGYMGTKIEDGLIELCKNQGIWEANNIKWQAYGISGEVDIIIRVLNTEVTPPKEELYVVECKSCSGYYVNKELFGYYEGAGSNRTYIKGKPKDKHLLQSILYAHVAKEKGFKGTIIFYVSRDESKMTEFLITVDDDGNVFINGELDPRFKVQDIINRYQVLQAAIDSNELPDRDYKPEYSDEEVKSLYANKSISKTAHDNHINRKNLYCDSECNYCDFKLKCLGQVVQSTSSSVHKEDPFELIKTTQVEEKPDFFRYGSL
jgi:hypothetical protein